MSREVDDRVVRMQFDNAQFERNVKTSMNTLDKLKAALNFKGAADSLQEIDSASNFSFDGLAQSIQSISDRFSTWGIVGMRVINNITDKVMGLANQFVGLAKSMTFLDQAPAGWNKYAEKTSAVQTIMAATRKEFGEVDNQMELVSAQLSKLNLFTDETSYSFLDMVNNIGKFTSNNVSLETSVKAMEGISTWAAVSGANVNEAGRAMYNLSQALATGAVKLMDWKSIENANMATAEFKETALETAVAEKKLIKVREGLYRTTKGAEVTVEKFNQSLSEGWFTSDVLLKTLDKYGGFADKLMGVLDEVGGVTASDMLPAIEEFKAGTLDINEFADEAGVSAERMTEILTELSKDEYDLGRRAFAAAQEAKTFQEAIDSVKDAVSTGWMNTFEIIFGDYEKAKKLWTGLANELWEIFNGGAEYRNEQLQIWADKGGRDKLIEGVKNFYTTLKHLFDGIKSTFEDFFPKWDAGTLTKITDNFYKLSESFRDFYIGRVKFEDLMTASVEDQEQWGLANTHTIELNSAFSDLFAVLEFGKKVLSGVLTVLKPVAKTMWELSKWVGETIALPIGYWLRDNLYNIEDSEFMTKGFGKIAADLEKYGTKLIDFLHNFTEKNGYIGVRITHFIDGIIADFKKLFGKGEGSGFNPLESLSKFFGLVQTAFSKLATVLQGGWSTIKTVATAIKDKLFQLGESLFGAFKKTDKGSLLDLANTGIFTVILLKLKGFLEGLRKMTNPNEMGMMDGLKKFFNEDIPGFFDSIGKAIDVEAIKAIGVSMLMLAGSLWLLASIDTKKLSVALAAISVLFLELTKSVEKLSKTDSKGASFAKVSAIMLSLSGSLLILALAVKLLSTIGMEQMIVAMIATTALIIEMVEAMKIISRVKKTPDMKPLIAFALSILILTASVKRLSDLDQNQLIKGILAVGTLIAMMVGMMLFTNKVKAPKMGGLIALALSLLILVPVVRKFGELDEKTMTQGIIVVGGLMIFMSLLMGVLGKSNGFNTLAGSAAILVITAAIFALVGAMKLLGKMNPEELSSGLKGLGYSLGIVVASLLLLSLNAGAVLASSAALLVVSGALIVFTAGMFALSKIPFTSLLANLFVLAVALVAFGAAAFVLQPVIPALLGIAAALALLGVAMVTMSAGIIAFIAMTVIFANSIHLIVDSMTAFAVSILQIIINITPTIGDAVLAVITTIANVIVTAAPLLISTIGTLILAVLNGITNYVMPIVMALTNLVVKVLFGLAEAIQVYSPVLLLAIQNVLLSIFIFVLTAVKGLLEGIPIFGKKVSGALDGVIGNIEEVMDSSKAYAEGFDYGATLGDGVSEGIRDRVPTIQSEASIAKNAAFEGLEDVNMAAQQNGEDVGENYFNGIVTTTKHFTEKSRMLKEPLIEGMTPTEDEIATIADTTSTTFAEKMDANSFKFNDGGELAITELTSGMTSSSSITGIQQSGDTVTKTFADRIYEYDFDPLGFFGTSGFATGATSQEALAKVTDAGFTVGDTFMAAVNSKLDEHSPSREMFKIGAFAVQGFINGIHNMFSEAGRIGSSLGDIVLGSVSDGVLSVTDLVMDEIGDPVIRPVLDLSQVTSEARKLNGIISTNPFIGANRFSSVQFNQNGSNSPAGGMTFIQNNYSPKELSRSEIYRQTKNQFSAAKGLMDGI